jgi:hypothetical protein
MPAEEALVLPTRLGNVMRSFEVEPKTQYGMDAIVLWPRLVSVIPADYRGRVDDAKTSVDFMLKSALLNGLLALSILVAGLLYPVPLSSPLLWVPWIGEIVVLAVISYLCYLGAINRAAAWGTMVKGSFDLYRGKLLSELGYTCNVTTRAAERTVWAAISRQLLFGNPHLNPPFEYQDGKPPSPPYARGTSAAPLTDPEATPNDVTLALARGVSVRAADGTVTVTLHVVNTDKA